MFFRLLHRFNDHLDVYFGEKLLLRYVYMPRSMPLESPRPYIHPLNTLAGDTLTLFRPNDHRWQHGLSMAVPYLSGENFWGGPTYSRDEGYVQRLNNGQQRHEDWLSLTCDERAGVQLVERLTWITQSGERWIDEQRQINVTQADADDGVYLLTLHLQLTNIRGEALMFGSPTTEGRPQAGYGGLHWRGARDLQHGTLTLDSGQVGQADLDLMGRRGAWLAYSGVHDGVDRASTLIFVDSPHNPRYPTPWFTRTEQAAAVSFALCYDERLLLPPAQTLDLVYRCIVCSGALTYPAMTALVSGSSQ